jgi:hypothetical protein
MNTNQCAHTVDTYKLVSIPPEKKKKKAQPRREKSMEKQIVTKKNTAKNPQAQGSKTNLKQGRNKRGRGKGVVVCCSSKASEKPAQTTTTATTTNQTNRSRREREKREKRERERGRGQCKLHSVSGTSTKGKQNVIFKCNPAPGTSINRDTERHVRCNFRQAA